ncbi:MAG: hypothetical protein IPJ13_30240 [Saprospiraceae bacterium]|nr:hypothetical protein [Saprospiraceae bacterium]
MEKGERELSLDATNKIALYFGLTIDQLLNDEQNIPQEITTEDKLLWNKLNLSLS